MLPPRRGRQSPFGAPHPGPGLIGCPWVQPNPARQGFAHTQRGDLPPRAPGVVPSIRDRGMARARRSRRTAKRSHSIAQGLLTLGLASRKYLEPQRGSTTRGRGLWDLFEVVVIVAGTCPRVRTPRANMCGPRGAGARLPAVLWEKRRERSGDWSRESLCPDWTPSLGTPVLSLTLLPAEDYNRTGEKWHGARCWRCKRSAPAIRGCRFNPLLACGSSQVREE
jgi:hypothetical protein